MSNFIPEFHNAKDLAYWERNQLVAALSKMCPSHLCRHEDSDAEWENDWRNIVCVHTPADQITWHIHDSELPYFEHLHYSDNHYDGHSNEEKYIRLSQIFKQMTPFKEYK